MIVVPLMVQMNRLDALAIITIMYELYIVFKMANDLAIGLVIRCFRSQTALSFVSLKCALYFVFIHFIPFFISFHSLIRILYNLIALIYTDFCFALCHLSITVILLHRLYLAHTTHHPYKNNRQNRSCRYIVHKIHVYILKQNENHTREV